MNIANAINGKFRSLLWYWSIDLYNISHFVNLLADVFIVISDNIKPYLVVFTIYMTDLGLFKVEITMVDVLFAIAIPGGKFIIKPVCL